MKSNIDEVKKLYNKWVDEIYDSNITKKLIGMKESEILDNFSGDLEFGTAGMRGVMAYGPNRMNEITVTRLAGAIARYVKENFKEPSVVIGFDTRHNSKKFSRVFARTLSSNGIKTYLYKKYCPTPILTYSILQLKTSMGIMITASHNNKIYNGVKVSDNNGIQISGNVQETLTKYYNETNGISLYNKNYNVKLRFAKNLVIVKNDLRNKYLTYDGEGEKKVRKVKIVYTPLNGTAKNSVVKLMKKNGFNVYIPKSQKKGNGDFVTCPYPNPEFEDAFNEAKILAKKIDADVLIATDPDGDRLGVMSKTKDGYRLLTGNEIGYIFLDRQCSKVKDKNAFCVSSVVTSPLAIDIANSYNAKMHRVLTGFKNIGKVMYENVQKYGKEAYTLAYEESCGYILRNDIYDKDGIYAALEMAKVADEQKRNKKTVYDKVTELYEKFGYLFNVNASQVFEGNNAKEIMQEKVDTLRKNPPKNLLKEKIEKITDYLLDDTGLEKQNFIKFESKTMTAIVRPSGTEPKLKFYIFAKSADKDTAIKNADELFKEIKEYVCK